MQTKGVGSNIPVLTAAPPGVREVLSSPGERLDPATRTFMEPRFGQDFSNLRVHIDARAVESAKTLSARAYTVGQDIVFAAGQYMPGSETGRRLLAHELAHVLQNTTPADANKPVIQRQEAARDDEAVQAHIDRALRQNSDQVGNATKSLMAERNESDCKDENIAAADHYMFARWLVGVWYVPAGLVAELTAGYALFKIVEYPQYAFLNWALGHCQASEPSAFQVKWGLKGVLDGKTDRASSWLPTPWWW